MNTPEPGKCYLCLKQDVIENECHFFPIQFGKDSLGGRYYADSFIVHPTTGFREFYPRTHPMFTKEHPWKISNPLELDSLAAKRKIFCRTCEDFFAILESTCIPVFNQIPRDLVKEGVYLPHFTAEGQPYIVLPFAANISKLFFYSIVWRMLLFKLVHGDYPYPADYERLRALLHKYTNTALDDIRHDVSLDEEPNLILCTRPAGIKEPYFLTTMHTRITNPAIFFMAEYNVYYWLTEHAKAVDPDFIPASKELYIKAGNTTRLAVVSPNLWLKPLREWDSFNLLFLKFNWANQVSQKYGMPFETASEMMEHKARVISLATGRFVLSCYFQVFRELM
jgi:hypothetical protein